MRWCSTRRPTRACVAADLLAQAEHGPASLVVAVSPSAEGLDALADPLANAQARAVLVDAPDLEAALAFVEDLAPEHLQLMGEDAEGLAPRRAPRRDACSWARHSGTAFGDYVAGSNHVLPTGGAARFASALSPRTFRRTMAEVRVGSVGGAGAGGSGDRARRGVRRPRRSRWRRGTSGTMAAMAEAERTAECSRRTEGTGVELTVRLWTGWGRAPRSTGVGFLDHMLDLLARHGRLDLDVQVQGDLDTGSHHTVEDTGICLGQALDAALGEFKRGGALGHAIVPMDESLGDGGDGRSRGGRTARSWRSCRLGQSRASTVGGRRVLPGPSRWRRSSPLHLRVESGTNAHRIDRGRLQGVRPRAAGSGRSSIPSETGVPRHQGDADVNAGGRRSGWSTPGSAIGAGSRRRSCVSRGRSAITHDHGAARGDGLVVPGVGAFPRACVTGAALGLDELVRERARAGVPLLGICLGMQALFEASVELRGAAGLGLLPGRVQRLEAAAEVRTSAGTS